MSDDDGHDSDSSGFAPSDSDEDVGAEESESVARMRALMSSFYGTSAEEEGASGASRVSDLDSNSFQVDPYVRGLLQQRSMHELLDTSDELVRDIKSLDSDMQMLVYENYQKFISATDTIRQMKSNVEGMATELVELTGHMERVSERSAGVNSALGENREKIEKLVGVRRLLKRLEFLFELPQRLRQSIEVEAYAQAAKYFRMTGGILDRYSHVSSFKAIQEESKRIMDDLRDDLHQRAKDPNITSFKLADLSRLLIDLGVPREDLRGDFLAWHGRALREALDPFLPLAAEVGEADILSLLSRTNRTFLDSFVLVASQYAGLFVEGAAEEDAAAAQAELVALARENFALYFSVFRRQFRKKHVLCEDSPAEVDFGAMGVDQAQAHQEQLGNLIVALRKFMTDVNTAHFEVREARLGDRAAELVEAAVRFQIDLGFRELREAVMGRVTELHGRTYVPTGRSAAASAAASASASASGAGEGEGGEQAEAEEEQVDLAELVSSTSKAILADIELTLRHMQPLIATGTSLLADMGRMFADLVLGQLHSFLLWLNSMLEQYCDPDLQLESEDTNLDVGDDGGSHDVAVPELPISPRFVLVLAIQCRDLEAQVLSKAMGTLVPLVGGGGAHSESLINVTELVAKSTATSERLLLRYVQLTGSAVARMVRKAMETPDWLRVREPREVRLAFGLLLDQVAAASREVGAVLQQAPPAAARSDTRDMRRSTRTGALPARKGVQLDIDRIFAKRVQIFSAVQFTRESVVGGLLKIAFKTLYECARTQTFGRNGLQQAQVDVHFLRLLLPRFVTDASTLETLLDEALVSVSDRCLDPTPMDAVIVETLAQRKSDSLELSL